MAFISASGFGWRHAGRRRPALSDVDVRIDAGEKVLLLGPSGAGKSTLLAAIAGVLGDDEDGEDAGSLLVDGRDPAEVRGVVGLVLQDPDSQVISARVGDDVAFGAENLGVSRDEIWRRVRRGLDLVGLDLPLDHPTKKLSGGQKQRLALAGVLAMGARVICLDEPTANIDPEGVPQLRDAAIRAAEATGAALVVVEHRVEAWVDHVDRILVLDSAGEDLGSTVVADGPPSEILARYGDHLRDAGVWLPGPPPEVGSAVPVPASAEAALRLDDLAVGYGGDTPVRRGIDAAVPSAASTCIVGPNGSGKSTLALTMGGLLEPMGGAVVASERIARGAGPNPLKWKSKQLARRIGSVFQAPEHQFVTPTVREELELGPKLLDDPAGEDRVDELLQRLRLTHVAGANPFTLSGGEKRRLSVATVLSTAPSMVILDEPTFGQDRRTFAELLRMLRGLVDEGVTVASITHDPLVVAAMGDHVIDLGEVGHR
ncbi:ABC transporter ATP-binding protein [Corynebacterium freneyi]|uniref:ABC transporter ATP-binding protein n=1 Tax=Corynebacterium freneyi DNF00450 TaxID=1287475 RepID=A0A095Y2X6_9CORY|nr:ABC transporter ATP-binding protein [Corynebacterium freneyi]KGF16376.1 ABC transporter ATP-binding protein [Corynebacterium freneyi DNF00450]